MTKKEKKQKTMKASVAISLTVSLVIIMIILYFTIDADTIDQLKVTRIKYEFFLIAVLLNILYWFLWGARLKVLSNAFDKNIKISLWESTKIIIANLFLACITPSMAGGEPVRIHLLNKDGMSLGGATAVVIGERLLDAIFILIVVPVAFFILQDVRDLGFLGKGLLIGIVVFAGFIVLFIYAILHPEKTKGFLIFISKKLSRFSKKKDTEGKIISKINKEVDNFHNSMMSFIGNEGRKALFKASVLTVLFWSTGFIIPSMILLGLGLPPFYIESYAAQILLLVIIMMPTTPGSAGIAEAGIYWLYGMLIGTGEGSLIGVFLILYRFISYYMNLIAGAFFQYRIFKSVASFSMDMIKKKKE